MTETVTQICELLHEAAKRITACSGSSTATMPTGRRGTQTGWSTFRSCPTCSATPRSEASWSTCWSSSAVAQAIVGQADWINGVNPFGLVTVLGGAVTALIVLVVRLLSALRIADRLVAA